MQTTEVAARPPHVPEDRVVDFDIYFPPGGRSDFHGAWKSIQDSGYADVIWTPRNGGHWMVTSGSLVPLVLADFENFSSRVLFVPKALGEHHKLLPSTMDPPGHRPYRNLLNAGLAPKVVKTMEGVIRDLAIELIESFHERGACNFTTDYAEQLPIRIFMEMSDLPMEDAPKVKYWTDQTTRPDGSMPYDEAIQAFHDYFAPKVKERRGEARTDLMSLMINGQVNGRPLTDDEAIKLCSQVLIAGLDTVVNLLSFVMLFLAQNPGHRHEFSDRPEIVSDAVDELIRRYGVVTVGREVKRDMEFSGVLLKQGEMIIVPTMLHGLDTALNPEPMTVCFTRSGVYHSTFGNGAHRCPGAQLARTELRITIEEWLRRIPDFNVAPDADIRYTGGVVACIDSLPLVWTKPMLRRASSEPA